MPYKVMTHVDLVKLGVETGQAEKGNWKSCAEIGLNVMESQGFPLFQVTQTIFTKEPVYIFHEQASVTA